jgi:hypothetical protein
MHFSIPELIILGILVLPPVAVWLIYRRSKQRSKR